MTTRSAIPIDETIEASQVRFGERPLTFAEYLEIPDPNHEYELTNGVLTRKISAQLDHETLQLWLSFILNGYASARDMGVVLGSRTAIEIDRFAGRMPDLLFVRKDRLSIVQQKGIFGAPDLVIEIVSPNDRVSGLRSLEADYRRIGVDEILFIDLRRGGITIVRKRDGDYEAVAITQGDLRIESMDGLILKADWLLREPRPDPLATLLDLLKV